MLHAHTTHRSSWHSGISQQGFRLNDAYNHWYEVISADTQEHLDLVYKLRYQVYCCENKYEESDAYQDCMEIDEYDCRSAHSLLIDRSNGSIVGTVRIILPELTAFDKCIP